MCHSGVKSIFAVLVLVMITAATASAQSKDVSSGGEAKISTTFDFSASALNFRTTLPPDAEVETVPMDAAEPNTIGNVKIIGKIRSAGSGPQVKTTIVGYNLQAPAAASRICSFEETAAGYIPRISKVAVDLTEAQMLGNKAVNGKPESVVISYCFARADHALAIHFMIDVSNALSEDAADDLALQADRYATSFISDLK